MKRREEVNLSQQVLRTAIPSAVYLARLLALQSEQPRENVRRVVLESEAWRQRLEGDPLTVDDCRVLGQRLDVEADR